MWARERTGIIIIVEDLDIQLGIVGTKEQRTELEIEGDWNTDRD